MTPKPSSSAAASSGGGGKAGGGYYWLLPFVPAFLYFAVTRAALSTRRGGIGRRYDVVADSVVVHLGDGEGGAEKEARVREVTSALGEIFYLPSPPSSKSSESSSPGATPNGGGSKTPPPRPPPPSLSLLQPFETILSGPPPGPPPIASTGIPSSSSSPNPLLALHSLLWVHSSELGRGYLLLSDSANSGRIWRWEVGGGPITIGRSLHMEWSGCRSDGGSDAETGKKGGGARCPDNKLAASTPPTGSTANASPDDAVLTVADGTMTTMPLMGSSGMAIQFERGSEHSREGSLLVLERGERRLVRIEEDGARTPLALDVPVPAAREDGDGDGEEGGGGGRGEGGRREEGTVTLSSARMAGDGRVAYTPFGDAVFSDSPYASASGVSAPSFAGVYRLREASNVPAVPSSRSLAAHYWNSTAQLGVTEEVELLYSEMETVSGLVLCASKDEAGQEEEGVLVAGRLRNGTVGIVWVPLDDDDDEEENAEDDSGDKSGDDEDADGGQPTAAVAADDDDAATVAAVTPSPGLMDSRARLVHDLSDLFLPASSFLTSDGGPALTIDSEGRVYTSYPAGALVLSSSFERLGSVPLVGGHNDNVIGNRDSPPERITDLEIGEDGYLYACTARSLIRVKVKSKMVSAQTDLVVPGAKKKTT